MRADGTTQGPFNRNLLADAIRQASGVPRLADQEAQRLELEKARVATAAAAAAAVKK